MNIGYAIRFCRQQRRLSIPALAKAAGVSPSYLSLVERGKRQPSLEKLQSLSAVFGVPVSLLIFLASNPDELAEVAPEVHEKVSAAMFKLLQAAAQPTNDREQQSLL